jgi:C-terminal processing protease CtpA/Prc
MKLILLLLIATLLLIACSNEPETTEQPEVTATDQLSSTRVLEEEPSSQRTITPTPLAEETLTESESDSVEESAEENASNDEETIVEQTPEESVDQFPLAEIANDEGGPVHITGVVTYTNPTFTRGVAQPLVILEDQSGFVERDKGFLMPPASQTLGQITSDFFTSPFSYSLALPIEPQGLLNDVDNDDMEDVGVQVFAVAYWTNAFGDPFLEARDLSGGGWSTTYVSTEVSVDADTIREVVGGKLLIFAPDDEQAFPVGFGDDGLLFTEDDPIVAIPQGYSVVNLDVEPFTFDRAKNQVIDLIESEGSALDDYSEMSYSESFDTLVDQLSKEYAFTEFKDIDWNELRSEFMPRFEEAAANDDALNYRRALQDFAWSIPDRHVSGPLVSEDFRAATAGGLGIAIRDVDDGRIVVNYLLEGSPADEAGIELGAEIQSINGQPAQEFVSQTFPLSGPFSTEHYERLQQLRYASRFPLETEVELSYVNPGSSQVSTATLTAVPEQDSFRFSSFNIGRDGFEQPVEYEFMADSGFGYVKIYGFFDNELLTIQLWERFLRNLNEAGVPGLVIDMRQNGGGNGFLADQMAAYFFDEQLILGSYGEYDEELDDFYFDPRREQKFYPPSEELRYVGLVAVIVGPDCASACEFFSYDMTVQDRATVVGHYPTAGAGGSIKRVLMPEGEFFQFTKGRAVDADGNIHIEGQGVPPDVVVPVTPDILLSEGDPLLEAAIDSLNEGLLANIVDGGEVSLGDEITGNLESGTVVRYTLSLAEGDEFTIYLETDAFQSVFSLFDEDENFLGAAEGGADPVVPALESPSDLILILEVSAGDEGGGDFLLRIENEGE